MQISTKSQSFLLANYFSFAVQIGCDNCNEEAYCSEECKRIAQEQYHSYLCSHSKAENSKTTKLAKIFLEHCKIQPRFYLAAKAAVMIFLSDCKKLIDHFNECVKKPWTSIMATTNEGKEELLHKVIRDNLSHLNNLITSNGASNSSIVIL